MSEALFSDLKVIDMSSWIAAPVASTMLADYGAQVIKIEPPGIGDGYRLYASMASAPKSHINYTWHMDNRNKRGLTLNLKHEEGREILSRLVRESDVFITNLNHPKRKEWSLGYDDLAALNPSLIYASLTAYGEQGPERDREGFDLVAHWSRSGMMGLVRTEDAPPSPCLPGMGDHPTGVSLYAAIVTAVVRRLKTGEGSHVHTSLLANGLWSASCVAQAAFVGADFSHYYRARKNVFTRFVYQTADERWLQFSMVRTDAEVAGLLAVLGHEALLDDERFATLESRFAHGDVLFELLAPTLEAQTAAYWMERFAGAGVPVALVGDIEDLPHDLQVIENAMTLEGSSALGFEGVIRHPLNVEGLTSVQVKPAPELGEHNSEILRELGYDTASIAALRDGGVI